MSRYFHILFLKINCTWNFERSNKRFPFEIDGVSWNMTWEKKNPTKSALHKQQIKFDVLFMESYREDNGETRAELILGSYTVYVHANL